MMQAAKADQILARFPGPVTLYPSRKKWLVILLGCALFTAAGVWMVATDAPNGWLVVLFFGAGSAVAATLLLPGAAQLTLDADGFQVTSLFRRFRSRWQDVSAFEVVSVPPANLKLVGYNDIVAKRRMLGALNRTIAGRNAALPDNYGLAVNDLAQLMSFWRERAQGAGPRT